MIYRVGIIFVLVSRFLELRVSDQGVPPPTDPTADPSAAPMLMTGPSWQEQDPVLRDLWLQNKSPNEISTVLGRSVAAIMTRAARLGLPRRAAPGRKPGSRRPPMQEGQSRPTTTPRTSALGSDETASAQISTRVCLMCLRPFQSLGRHNRICPSCKGSAEYESAVSLADINLPV